MQLRHLNTLLPATDGMAKITSITWSGNNKKLAVVTIDHIIHLFDAITGEKKDKFSTKPAEKGDKTYIVQSIVFSPDSTKLAVAQSDNIVFIYKIGLEWGDKKSICNKFNQNASITSLSWPIAHPNEIVFGLTDGKVKVGQLRTNKSSTLYTTGSYVINLCSGLNGHTILSGHLDYSIYRYTFDDPSGGPANIKIAIHSCIPYALGWGEHIVAAGNDKIVTFYDSQGTISKLIDYSNETNHTVNPEINNNNTNTITKETYEVGEFTIAEFNPTGDTVVIGNYNSFYIFNLNSKTKTWEQVQIKKIDHLYTITSLAWKKDGSRLAIGNICGSLDLFDACIKRYRYKNKYDFTYVSLSQVIIKEIKNNNRILIRSQYNYEILKINIFQDRFLIANTNDTLILADIQKNKISEIQWQSNSLMNEKYSFENENICIVFLAGELSLIEYGSNEIVGSVRTEYMNNHLLSVRINERPFKNFNLNDINNNNMNQNINDNKKIAYLLDLQTISIKDLCLHYSNETINHDAKIDWLELNERGNLLLFRDRRRQLHLYNINQQNRSTLLNYCNYVQWVPNSDVVVAQSRSNLYVWYNIHFPNQSTIYPIKGDIEQIERLAGKTQVITDDGNQINTYLLDENLIAFGTAIDDNNLLKAIEILEPLEINIDIEAMWNQLSNEAIKNHDHIVAERCAAALGDVPRSRYLRKLNKLAKIENNNNNHHQNNNLDKNGFYHWSVRSRLFQLNKDFRSAEDILISQNQIDYIIEMYQLLHKWEDAIRIAEKKNHPNKDNLKKNYFEYLLNTRQEEKAALLKEKEGDYINAIHLYLKGNFPVKACQLLIDKNIRQDHELFSTIATSLYNNGMYEKAGDLFERMDQEERSLECYIKANSYRKAVELARKYFPQKVVRLEEAWGDYLVSQKQIDMAINHYIEANIPTKAVEAALNSRQWSKASQLVETLDTNIAKPYYRRLARHYQDNQNYEAAEICFIRADAAKDAVEMYTKANKWDAAHKIAVNYMNENDINNLYIQEAHRMENKNKLKEAEKLYLMINEPDLAINMYKIKKNYDQMIRLVTKYRKDLLKETHIHLGQQLEIDGNIKDAEHHYTEAGEWQIAVNMYRNNDLWDEAIRVAKYHGGINASKRVAYAWAMSLGGEAGAKLLTKLNLIDSAIDYAIENASFDHAFDLARTCAPKKLAEIHLKHALYLEDEEKFREAEQEFIKAGKPREAVDMYIHQHDWLNAMRVAETVDPGSISDIFIAQARLYLEKKEYQKAETLFLNASRPELILAAYQEVSMWEDALRIAKRYVPNKINEISLAYQRSITSNSSKTKEDMLSAAKLWETSHQYSQAIDAYLAIGTEQTEDISALEKIWENAIKLCANYDRSRYKTVVEEVGKKLQMVQRYSSAAELYKDIDQMDHAIECYIQDKRWDEAIHLCRSYAPELLQKVEKAKYSFTISSGTAEEKQAIGETDSAMEIWIQKGEWDKVLLTAQEQNPKVLSNYLQIRCRRLADLGEYDQIIQTIIKYNTKNYLSLFDIHIIELFEIAIRQSLGSERSKDTNEHKVVIKELSKFLILFNKELKLNGQKEFQSYITKFDQLLLICHYFSVQIVCMEHHLKDLASKISMSLLRFINILPADKMFYLAGEQCRDIKLLSPAFVFFNRYLDLTEAMEEGDYNGIENTDFLGTDIPSPDKFILPSISYISDENMREDIREWVLAISMDQQITEKLPEKQCISCNVLQYEGNLKCFNCKNLSEPCIITGFPVSQRLAVHCTNCSNIADRDNWNKWLKEIPSCPWCSAPQKLSY